MCLDVKTESGLTLIILSSRCLRLAGMPAPPGGQTRFRTSLEVFPCKFYYIGSRCNDYSSTSREGEKS
jgi:hypothetical protein